MKPNHTKSEIGTCHACSQGRACIAQRPFTFLDKDQAAHHPCEAAMVASERIDMAYSEADNRISHGEKEILKAAPVNPDRIQIYLHLPGFEKSAAADDYFQVLQNIRVNSTPACAVGAMGNSAHIPEGVPVLPTNPYYRGHYPKSDWVYETKSFQVLAEVADGEAYWETGKTVPGAFFPGVKA